ncbi:hypothetical protein RAS1_21920 [Phycisphaerae bacterium RAS1]|nr:hypothetical protein RAS1_21920 [Phycisphaerae bacterium RAS1]
MSDSPFFTSRREFLVGGLTFLSASATLPLFLGNTARVLAGPETQRAKKRADERILVVVQLAGGNDGLNTVVPYSMDPYYQARRTLAIPKKDVLQLEKGVGLHPAATGLKQLFDDGRMAIIQGVGYPNPNRSHFTSMDIWHTADPLQRKQSGWLGRYFDSCCKGSDPAPEPIDAIALMQESPLALQGENFAPLAFENADTLAWRNPKNDAAAMEAFRKLNNIEGDIPASGNKLEQFLQRAALKAQVGADEIRTALGTQLKGKRFGRRGGPGELARQLEMVARMIKADLPTRIYYVSMGGFDTHSGQLGRHQQLVRQFGDAMQDFVESLEDDGLLDRVLIMSFSEFGRRVQENASGGTDHGEAAPMFLFGKSLKPGLHLDHPDLANLHRGDLPFGCDFRRVYASLLRFWLQVDPVKILGGGVQPLPLLKATG